MNGQMSPDAAAQALSEAVRDTIHRHATLFLFQGVLMVLLGIVAVLHPWVATVAVTLFLGWLLVISGLVQAMTLIGGGKVPHFWLQLISAVLFVVVGFLFIRHLTVGVATLVLLMIVFFMVEGLAKIMLSLTVRPLRNWGWVLASGVLGVLIALWLVANPGMSVMFLGILFGVQLIAEGVAIGAIAWQARHRTAGSAPVSA